LPDKAIDLIDEAAAKVKTEMHSLPVELDRVNREIVHKETERASLLNENDIQSQNKLIEIDNALIELKKTKEQEEKI
jgi:ATP-dependent Clp protease ATP-binding subunit ClpB